MNTSGLVQFIYNLSSRIIEFLFSLVFAIHTCIVQSLINSMANNSATFSFFTWTKQSSAKNGILLFFTLLKRTPFSHKLCN